MEYGRFIAHPHPSPDDPAAPHLDATSHPAAQSDGNAAAHTTSAAQREQH
ncbi:MAG: hypothetical protein ACKO9F_13925 [Caldilinea sp.]